VLSGMFLVDRVPLKLLLQLVGALSEGVARAPGEPLHERGLVDVQEKCPVNEVPYLVLVGGVATQEPQLPLELRSELRHARHRIAAVVGRVPPWRSVAPTQGPRHLNAVRAAEPPADPIVRITGVVAARVKLSTYSRLAGAGHSSHVDEHALRILTLLATRASRR
jgi:hypothetical protein